MSEEFYENVKALYDLYVDDLGMVEIPIITEDFSLQYNLELSVDEYSRFQDVLKAGYPSVGWQLAIETVPAEKRRWTPEQREQRIDHEMRMNDKAKHRDHMSLGYRPHCNETREMCSVRVFGE